MFVQIPSFICLLPAISGDCGVDVIYRRFKSAFPKLCPGDPKGYVFLSFCPRTTQLISNNHSLMLNKTEPSSKYIEVAVLKATTQLCRCTVYISPVRGSDCVLPV